MKSITLILFFLCTSWVFSYGQNHKLPDSVLNKSTASKIRFADTVTCEGIDQWIKSDISNKTIFLFLQGGLAPAVYSRDSVFENKYNVYYYDFGDVGFPDYKCVIKYDDYIFNYLTKTYGKKWMKEIRKDVIGYHEWKSYIKQKSRPKPGS